MKTSKTSKECETSSIQRKIEKRKTAHKSENQTERRKTQKILGQSQRINSKTWHSKKYIENSTK